MIILIMVMTSDVDHTDARGVAMVPVSLDTDHGGDAVYISLGNGQGAKGSSSEHPTCKLGAWRRGVDL